MIDLFIIFIIHAFFLWNIFPLYIFIHFIDQKIFFFYIMPYKYTFNNTTTVTDDAGVGAVTKAAGKSFIEI